MMRILSLFLVVLACEAKFWGYNPAVYGETAENCGELSNSTCGPTLWSAVPDDNSSCGNTGDQSPINVIPATSVVSAGSMAAGDVSFSSKTCASGGQFVVDSHTLTVNVPCHGNFTASWTANGTSTVYNLQQYHFHTPSEHTVDGQFFDMEVQLIHRNASDGFAGYLAVAVFLKTDPTLKAKCALVQQKHVHCKRADFLTAVLLGGMTEAALTTAVKDMGAPPATFTHTAANVSVDPYTGFMPPLGTHFYWYHGSWTSPPCSTGVTWILNPVHVLIYNDTAALFKRIVGSGVDHGLTQGTTPNQNNRPVQSMGLRRLYFVGELGHTTLTQAVLAGATSLPTWGHGGFKIGDRIIIDAGTPRQEFNTISSFGSIGLATPLQYNHPAGASVHDQSTTTPAVTVTPAPGAVTTTPFATMTPIIPLRRYTDSQVAATEDSKSNFASKVVCLGVGCLVGMAVFMVVQRVRSRTHAAAPVSTTDDCEEGEAQLLSGAALE